MWWWAAKAIASVVFWSLFLWADPFGIETVTKSGSTELLLRVASPHYRIENQDKIKVVLISDDDLPLSGAGRKAWPPRYDDYVTLLEAVAGTEKYKPTAIFFDILFENAPDSVAELQAFCRAAEQLEHAGTKVFFASLPDFDDNFLPMPSALEVCETRPNLASVRWRAEKGVYPFAVDLGGNRAPTAAGALYDLALGSANFSDAGLGKASQVTATSAPMRLVWGATLPAGVLLSEDGCSEDYRGGMLKKIQHSARIFVNGLIPQRARRDAFSYLQPCAFHETIPARSMMALSDREKENVAAALDGSFVFIGADIDGIPDFVDSPVHGRLPGVFIHAMALDNMLTFGSRYLRDAPTFALPFGGLDLGADAMLQTVLLLMLAITLAFLQYRPLAKTSEAGPQLSPKSATVVIFLTNTLTISLFMLIVILVALISFFFMRWTPLNYGAVLLAGGEMMFSSRWIARFVRL